MNDDTITIEAFQAIKDYLTHITKVGYMSYDNVYRLIAYLYVDDLLKAYKTFDITENDYKIISDFMQCLYGTCLLPYPEYIQNLPYVNNDNIYDLLRGTEDSDIRQTEDGNYRIVETNTFLSM